MCKSIAEGGQRCAAHTRAGYLEGTPGTPEWAESATQYASTPEGKKVILTDIGLAEESGDYTRAAELGAALRLGRSLHDANKEAARITAAAHDWEPGTLHPSGSYDQIQTDDGAKFYTRNGALSRNDGPAVVYPDGEEEFWRDGEMYCEMACLRGNNPPQWCTRREGD